MHHSKTGKFSLFSLVLLSIMAIMSGCDLSQNFKHSFMAVGEIPPASIVDTTFNRLLDSHIKKNLEDFECPGVAVLVVQNNQLIFEKLYGTKSIYSNDSIDAMSVFRLGSLSKGFAGILAAILIDQNIIHLDDPLTLYVPELKLQAKTKDKILRVKHILTHSSGLTEHAYSNLVDDNRDMNTIIQYLNGLTPRDSTGKAYAYQNAAFGLIEKVIEEATGMTYTKALEFYIFSPLNMCNTSCTFEELCNAQNVCTGHKYGGQKKGFIPVNFNPHYYNVISAGGVNANLTDMKKWLDAVMGYHPEVISPNARTIAFAPYINTAAEDKYFNSWPGIKNSHYGLGWRLITTQNNNIVYHGGLVNGFRTEIAFDKEKDIGVVFLFNSLCGFSNRAVPTFFELWNEYHSTNDESDKYL